MLDCELAYTLQISTYVKNMLKNTTGNANNNKIIYEVLNVILTGWF